MATPKEARDRASSTYNAAADSYDADPLSFWSYFGQRTVEHLGLCDGNNVLDVACGAGASAIPAAEAVAPTGSVLAVDLAEKLLELARHKAEQRNLTYIQFQHGDMMALNQPPGRFDAVICVFGIFFVPDMVAAVKALWQIVRPGGKLAVTTWGANLFEPANSAFWNSIKRVRPDLERAFNPWDRISEPAALRRMLEDAGVANIDVTTENRLHPLHGPDDWWTIVRGSGYRGTIEQLATSDCDAVRQVNIKYIRENQVTAVETNALYAIARKQPLQK